MAFEEGGKLDWEKRWERQRLVIAQRVRKELKKLNARQLDQIRRGKKHYLGHELWEGWTAPIAVYLFYCTGCEHYSLDYPHGFIQNQYLTCQNCRRSIDFVPWWVPWAQLWDLIRIWWKYRKGIPEKEEENEKKNAQSQG